MMLKKARMILNLTVSPASCRTPTAAAPSSPSAPACRQQKSLQNPCNFHYVTSLLLKILLRIWKNKSFIWLEMVTKKGQLRFMSVLQ